MRIIEFFIAIFLITNPDETVRVSVLIRAALYSGIAIGIFRWKNYRQILRGERVCALQ